MRSVYTAVRQKYAAPTILVGRIAVDLRLTHLQESVLRFFAVHRIATANLIKRTWPQDFPYHKKAIRCLRSLCDRGLLRERRPESKFDDVLFTITEEGYRTCRDLPGIDLESIPYAYDEPTGKQADHDLLITQTAVLLYEYAMERRGVSILEDGRFGNCGGVFAAKVPDYRFLARDSNGMMLRLVEVISGVESSSDIREMFSRYDSWAKSESAKEYLVRLYRKHGAREPIPEFRVACIVHSRNWKYTDAWKERLTLQQTFAVSPSLQARVETTTLDALGAAIDSDFGINAPVWHRGSDLLGNLRRQFQVGEGIDPRAFDRSVRDLPLYPLFR